MWQFLKTFNCRVLSKEGTQGLEEGLGDAIATLPLLLDKRTGNPGS
jgi:hypothetical protein